MKRNIIYLVALLFFAFGFTSCDKESEGLTGMVDYVVLQLQGDTEIKLKLNEAYVEPGFVATDKGKDVKDKVNIIIKDMLGNKVDAVTTTTPGIFTLTYSATSEDKMPISVERKVFVYDPDLKLSIAGTYTVDFAQSQRITKSEDGTSTGRTWASWSEYYTSEEWQFASYSLKEIEINFTEVVAGIYQVDDLLGGFYTGLRGYGPYYQEANGANYYHYFSMQGTVILNADNTLSLVSSKVRNWEDSLEDFNGTYDESTKTLNIHSIYGKGKDFNVIMVKKEK